MGTLIMPSYALSQCEPRRNRGRANPLLAARVITPYTEVAYYALLAEGIFSHDPSTMNGAVSNGK